LRMQTVEPVFGQIKQGRGFRQFLLRGLETPEQRAAKYARFFSNALELRGRRRR
jgi:hypothetical protein